MKAVRIASSSPEGAASAGNGGGVPKRASAGAALRAALGNDDWGYGQVLPFFRRAERNERLNDEFHSCDGAMNVTEQVQHNELSKAFVRAAQKVGS